MVDLSNSWTGGHDVNSSDNLNGEIKTENTEELPDSSDDSQDDEDDDDDDDEDDIQRQLLAQNPDFDSSDDEEDTEQDDVTVDELTTIPNIKEEKTDLTEGETAEKKDNDDLEDEDDDDDDVQDQLSDSDSDDEDETSSTTQDEDMEEDIFDEEEDKSESDSGEVSENVSDEAESSIETTEEEGTDTAVKTQDEISDLQQEKLKEVEDLLVAENGGWKCKDCSRIFSLKGNLRQHAEIHVSGLTFPCNHCSERFTTRMRLATHKKGNHRSKKNTKNRVEISQDKKSALQLLKLKEVEELLVKAKNGGWKCKRCKKIFRIRSTLRKHAEIHVSGLSFPCHDCSDIFTTRLRLARHKNVQHTNNRETNIATSSSTRLGNHGSNTDNKKDTRNITEEVYFYSKTRKIIHNEKLKEVENLLVKVGDLWKCKACDKTLKQKTKLRIHAEIHVEGLSYQCKTCTKIFSTQNNLWSHISHIHTNHGGSDAFTGDLPGTEKSESDEEQVSEGELIPCDLNREISEKIQKLIVKKNHNTWKCRKCPRTSTQKYNLLSHLETHLNYTHPCPRCKTTTRTRKSLREHFRVNHSK